MINHYTANRKVRNDDAYSPGGQIGRRPDRATLAYCQRAREAFKGVPVIAGGVEASLRRIAHYDYWSDKVRRSIVLDCKADLLVFGMGERTIVEIARRLARRRNASAQPARSCAAWPIGSGGARQASAGRRTHGDTIRLPSYEAVSTDQLAFCEMTKISHSKPIRTTPGGWCSMHGPEAVVVNPPALPLSQPEMDRVYGLPYTRKPHPCYGEAKHPGL